MRIAVGVVGVLAVGLGCSGAGGSAPEVCRAVDSGGRLDTMGAVGLVVAPDERHLAFVRDPQTVETDCPSRTAAYTTGQLVVLGLQPDGSSCERVIAQGALAGSVAFGADSRALVFRDEIDVCGSGNLKTANVNSGNVRLVHGSVIASAAVGSTVLFNVKDDPDDLAAPIAGGNAIDLGTNPSVSAAVPGANPKGTAFAYTYFGSDEGELLNGSLILKQLPSGASQRLTAEGEKGYPVTGWSRGGDWLAFQHSPSGATPVNLALITSDGARRVEVSTTCTCRDVVFAPDESWLAYDEPDGSGQTRLMTHSLKSGGDVALGLLPAGAAQVLFSEDSANVVALVEKSGSGTGSVFVGTTGVSNSLRLLSTDAFSSSGSMAASAGHLAIAATSSMLAVLPLDGRAAVTVPGLKPRFEPTATAPHLLITEYGYGGIGVTAGDGTAGTFYTASGALQFATWMESTVVYGSGYPPNIAALTNGGTVSTPLANSVDAYGWAPIAAPTRLFYARQTASADGPAGVWVVDLPR